MNLDNCSCGNLVELLRHWATTTPNALAYTFLKDGRDESLRYTYQELDKQARAIAVALSGAVGKRALLLYPPGIEFIAGFFGALYAGVIAIPAPPPDAARLKRTLPRLTSIIRDAEASWVLATGELVDTLAKAMAVSEESPTMRWLATDRVDTMQADQWPGPPAIDDSSIAYLQYTSGSTSTPKGVMLTHRNLMCQSVTLQGGFGYDRNSIAVTWMPYFHDYGLVDGLIQPLYNGIPCYVLSPLTFLRRPERWLEVISRYRATHTQAPNFAYEQCIQKISAAKRATLDLRSLREASNGAEPIRRDTVEGFIATFAECGLHPEAIYPAYGLAEATLQVTAKPHRTLPRYCHADAAALEQNQIIVVDPEQPEVNQYRSIVSCGVPAPGVEVVIADLATSHALPDSTVGEIWVASDSIGAGYWRRPEESVAIFRARLANQPERGPFLRTGDLGFMLDGELYMTGRQKDLIIIAGVNHYPQDIEWTVQTLDSAFRRDHCAAFSLDVDGEERLVVVAEMERQYDDWTPLLNAVRRAISENHEIELYGLQLLKKGEVLKTSSGKLQRRDCHRAYLHHHFNTFFRWQRGDLATAATTAHPADVIEQWLLTQLAKQLGVPSIAIQRTTPFAEYGLTSRGAVSFVGKLEEWLGKEGLPATLLWEYPTVATLRDYLLNGGSAVTPTPHLVQDAHEPLAIIGMACRLPGATNPDEFWELLAAGRDAISEVPPTRWSVQQLYAPEAGVPGHINNRYGGFLDAVDGFDAAFFGITPPEATVIDPQQRLLLELTWEALEAAGIDPRQLAGSDSGVFIGISTDDYSERQFADRERISLYAGPGKAFSIAANRISYQFDLHGPSMALDTACSSSLVALHQAAQALRRGECALALVGGVNLLLSPSISIALSQAGMLSPDGRCKAFDAAANGYVRSEGGGMVVLKRLSDAQHDGDPILALLRGSAINQDGRSNGLTAPNGLAQQAVIRHALQDAGVEAHAIRVVEAHGTGTALGDPIEVRSLQGVLGHGRGAEQNCLIGAVKSNIGHLEAAAGIAGLIKLVLSLRQGQVPPTVHFQTLNPMITLHGTPFAIANRLQPWPPGERLASLSSFGFGGTNAHAILSAPPPTPSLFPELRTSAPPPTPSLFPELRTSAPPPTPSSPPPDLRTPDHHLLLISAHTPTALYTLAERYLTRLRQLPPHTCAAFCYSAAIGRAALPQRLALVGTDSTALTVALDDFVARRDGATPIMSTTDRSPKSVWLPTGVSATNRAPKSVWLFTGQGSQYSGMGQMLYQGEPFFRAEIDRCNQVLEPLLGIPLHELLYDERHAHLLDNTLYTQPVLFALEVALARTLLHWGIRPDAVLGHSVGEYSAACIAGVFSLESGLQFIAARGRLVEEFGSAGGMAAVIANEATVGAAIAGLDGIELATLNGPAGQVIAGSHVALAAATTQLMAMGLEVRPLQVSHPFHSVGMEPVQLPFAEVARNIVFHPPQIPLISNLSADFIAQPMADYWIDHLRQPVRFGASIERLLATGFDTFLEIGPKPTLLGMARRLDHAESCLWLPTLRAGEPDWQRLLTTLGRLWQRGITIDWRAMYGTHPRMDLPHYPFERKRFWLDDPSPALDIHAPTFRLQGEMIRSPLVPGILFQSQFSRQRFPFYGEHRVFGEVVIPAAGHLSLLLEAALTLNGEPACRLENLIFPQPLILPPEGERQVQLFVENASSDTTQPGRPFQLISTLANESATEVFETHASGILSRIAAIPTATTTTLPAVQAALKPNEGIDNFYTAIWQPHIELGPSFRCIETLTRHGNEALARLRIPVERGPYVQRYQLYPGLFDAALQVLAALVTLDANEAMIPFRIEQLSYYGYGQRRPQCFWSHITLRANDDPMMAVADVRLWAELGTGDYCLAAELRGFGARRVRRELLLRELQRGYQEHLYQIDWAPYSYPTPSGTPYQIDWAFDPTPVSVPDAGCWLLFNDRTGRATTLAMRQCQTVIEVSRPEQIAAHPNVDGVIFGAGLDLGGKPDMEAIEPVLTLLLAVIGQLATQPLPLVILTANAQTLLNRPGEPQQAALWALGRVIRREFPHCLLIDLEATPESDTILPPLLRGDPESDTILPPLLRGEHPGELAWRGGTLYQPLLQRYNHTVTTGAPIRADRAYLITGGLGELGLICAKWLVDQGAGTVILLGRRAPNASQQARLDTLRDHATTLRVVQSDVTDGAQLTALWPDLTAGPLPLAGIFHLAGVLDDGPLTQQSWARFAPVLAPKVNGSWHLHQLSQSMTLDHFVAFSSIAPLVGSAGQGNYAFANGYLDSLMEQRRAAGLPGLTLNWGPWRAGMAADLVQRFTDWGLEMIDPTRALITLTTLLAAPAPTQLAIFPVDWGRFIHNTGANPLYDHFTPTATADITIRWADTLEEAEPAQRWTLLEQHLRTTIAATIGLTDSSTLVARKRLFEIGLDSLGAMELRNRLVTLLGRDLRSTLLFDYPTLEALLNHIGNDVLGWPRHDATATTITAQTVDLALDTLSDDDLAALLAAELNS